MNKKIALYHENGDFIKEWESLQDCAKDLNTYTATIRDNLNGKIINGEKVKSYYRFKYI